MQRSSFMAMLVAGGLIGASPLVTQSVCAQSVPSQSVPSQSASDNAQQNAPAQNAQQAPAASSGQSSNPFPEDTNNVPVMPSKSTPALPPDTYSGDESKAGSALPLPSDHTDPVRSPDDASADQETGRDEASSSSSAGMDKLLPATDDDPQPGRHKKLAVQEPEHQETSAEDIQVGKYYLESKNWKAALSRFESALVLAPDEPDVYWGLAESARHLGNLAQARAYYQKVTEYDPDSKHGKEATRLLKDPEIANAKAAAPAPPEK